MIHYYPVGYECSRPMQTHFDSKQLCLFRTTCPCPTGTLDSSGKQIHFHQEAVLLFGVFDESKSWYSTGGPHRAQDVKYTINGYTNGSVPGWFDIFHT